MSQGRVEINYIANPYQIFASVGINPSSWLLASFQSIIILQFGFEHKKQNVHTARIVKSLKMLGCYR